jgi:hypothetical protein
MVMGFEYWIWMEDVPGHGDGDSGRARLLSGESGVLSSRDGSEGSGDGEELHVDWLRLLKRLNKKVVNWVSLMRRKVETVWELF